MSTLNQSLITEQLNTWLETFVEQPHPGLGGWAPCPYARAARLNNKLSITFCTVAEFRDVIRESIDTLASKEAVIICFDHHDIDPVTLQEWVADFNQSLLVPAGYVVLEDHPDAPEYVSGIKMNFGHCGLLIIQKLDRLNQAVAQLRTQGYYDHWDDKALEAMVHWDFE